jgi:hypothetical protein
VSPFFHMIASLLIAAGYVVLAICYGLDAGIIRFGNTPEVARHGNLSSPASKVVEPKTEDASLFKAEPVRQPAPFRLPPELPTVVFQPSPSRPTKKDVA